MTNGLKTYIQQVSKGKRVKLKPTKTYNSETFKGSGQGNGQGHKTILKAQGLLKLENTPEDLLKSKKN